MSLMKEGTLSASVPSHTSISSIDTTGTRLATTGPRALSRSSRAVETGPCHLDLAAGVEDRPDVECLRAVFQSPSSAGSTGSSGGSTPSAHTKSTSSPGDMVTRLDEQLKQAVLARRETPERQTPPQAAGTPRPAAPAPAPAAADSNRYTDGTWQEI